MSAITDYLTKLARDPSTYAGLALVVQGAGQVVHSAAAPAVAEAVQQAGQGYASGGWQGLITAGFGIAAAVLLPRGHGGEAGDITSG